MPPPLILSLISSANRASGGRVTINPKIDKSYDIQWVSVLSRDGKTFYRDRSLPKFIKNNGKILDIDKALIEHEKAEYAAMQEAVNKFKDKHGREPDDSERQTIYLTAHKDHGEVAERKYIETHGYSWNEWNRWTKGQIERLEKKTPKKTPKNSDVAIYPHGKNLGTTLRADGGRVQNFDEGGAVLEPSAADPYSGVMSMPDQSQVATPLKKLLGIDGEERYQTWPERSVKGAGRALNRGIDLATGLVSGVPDMIADIPHMAKRVATAPRDALSGELQVNDPETGMPTPEAMSRGNEFAGAVMGTAFPFAEKGAVGIFGGRLAKTADLDALKHAESMSSSGFSPTDVFKETGWFKGADDKWRFEIPDTSASYIKPKGNTVGKSFEHDPLFEAYPQIKNYPFSRSSEIAGEYNPNTKEVSVRGIGLPENERSTMLHELQHGVQHIEEFSPGVPANTPGYNLAAGEVEARNVQRRADMTPDQRRDTFPEVTQDRPSSRFNYIRFPEHLRMQASAEGLSGQGEFEEPLEGLPRQVRIPGYPDVVAEPISTARKAARDYMEEAGIPYEPVKTYSKVNRDNGKRIAQAYEDMKHDPDNPEVRAAYQAMADETMSQWQAIKKTGLKVDFNENPYPESPRLAIEDVKNNNHMDIYPTDVGFGEVGKGITKEQEDINPLLKQSGEYFSGKPARINDIFRVVHDYFGHAKEGVGFRADGEENAWRSHAGMYSPLARKAMTSETRGQNSWVNWGPHGEKNRTASTPDTVFADQKIGLLPDWVSEEGRRDPGVDVTHPDWIDTRLPTGKKITEPEGNRVVDLENMKKSPDLYEHNVGLVRDYPNMPNSTNNLSTDQAADHFINHVKDNLLWLHDQIPPEVRNRSKLWYDGARKIAEKWSKEFGIKDSTVSGIMAALSPQMDWFKNVSLARRVLDINKNISDMPLTSEMENTFKRIPALAKNKTLFNMMKGKSLSDIDQMTKLPVEERAVLKAMWTRLYDEAHHSKDYREVTPEGGFGDRVTTSKGDQDKISWGSLPMIAKAIRSIETDDGRKSMNTIMGMKHKIRNFYNNILVPNSNKGDVTIDTHAVAAGLLRPLSGTDLEVNHNFRSYAGKGLPNSKGSSVTGIQGTYPLYAEAYRKAAAERNILPREMQSITWEAIRGLFPGDMKGAKLSKAADDIWNEYKTGKASLDETRQKILEAGGGIRNPKWYKPSDEFNAASRGASDQGELPEPRLYGPATQAPGGGGRPAARPKVGGRGFYPKRESADERNYLAGNAVDDAFAKAGMPILKPGPTRDRVIELVGKRGDDPLDVYERVIMEEGDNNNEKKYSQKEMQEWARGYNTQYSPNEPGGGDPADFNWKYVDKYPTSRAEKAFGSQEDAKKWMQEEIDNHSNDGRPHYYDDMIKNDIKEPVIVVEDGNNVYPWDGNHRIAASSFSGKRNLPAIVGTRKVKKGNKSSEDIPFAKGGAVNRADGGSPHVDLDQHGNNADFINFLQSVPTSDLDAEPSNNIEIGKHPGLLDRLPFVHNRGGNKVYFDRINELDNTNHHRLSEDAGINDIPHRALGGRINHNPSEAQKEAGNYKKGKIRLHGLDISIENAKGSTRRGVNKDGVKWKSTLPAHYGYIKGSKGADEDHIDTYIGPNHNSNKVFVVNQRDVDNGAFEEHKSFIGFHNIAQVKNTFLRAFSDGKGKKRMGHITEMTVPEFKSFLEAETDRNTKP